MRTQFTDQKLRNSVSSRTNKTNGRVHTLVWHDDFVYVYSLYKVKHWFRYASTFTVASYVLILNLKRKLVTEMPFKKKMRKLMLFRICLHLTLKRDWSKKIIFWFDFILIISLLKMLYKRETIEWFLW